MAGGKFNVSYRRGYFARDTGHARRLFGNRDEAIHKLAEQNQGAVDPLLPFMDLGMPQSEQILYRLKIQACPAERRKLRRRTRTEQKVDGQSYAVDFAIDLKDLDLKLDPGGLHTGAVSVSLIAYDRYGKIGARKDFWRP